MPQNQDAARMELGADAWHQTDEGYYIDCPECGSAASLSNIITHGRCNGYLDEGEGETELDETAMSCSAVLSIELAYTSDPETTADEEAVGEGTGGGETADVDTDADDLDPDDEVEGDYEDSPVEGT